MTDRDRDRGRCSVYLYERHDKLIVKINSNQDWKWAKVRADFGRQDRSKWVQLDRRGDATVRFDIPDRARSVDVDVTIGRGHDRVTCDAHERLGGGRR